MAESGLVALGHGTVVIGIDGTVVAFEVVEQTGYQEQLLPAGMLVGKQMTKEHVALTKGERLSELKTLLRRMPNMRRTEFTRGERMAELTEE